MDDLRTLVKIEESAIKVNSSDAIILSGSCFSQNIGAKLEQDKFKVLCNPSGIVYNPVSIANFLQRASNGTLYRSKDLVMHEGDCFPPDHHGSFAANDTVSCLHKVNESIDLSSLFISKTDFLLITFGTAWVYKWKRDGRIMANCHKIPTKNFIKELLSVHQIVEQWKELIRILFEKNSEMKIIFSVSPVRHWNDGPVNNNYSKSVLLLAVRELVSTNENCYYFPAYEILLDELRDYRFYTEDMLHPSPTALKYIWERFKHAWIDKESFKRIADFEKLQAAVKHRPIEKKICNSHDFCRKTD